MTSTEPRSTDTRTVVGIVPHTHWDREWYKPAVRFRQELVALVDDLTDSPPADGASFLLGCQDGGVQRCGEGAPVGGGPAAGRRQMPRAVSTACSVESAA